MAATNNDAGLEAARRQVDEVQNIMKANVDKVLERDGKLSQLEDRADRLQVNYIQYSLDLTDKPLHALIAFPRYSFNIKKSLFICAIVGHSLNSDFPVINNALRTPRAPLFVSCLMIYACT